MKFPIHLRLLGACLLAVLMVTPTLAAKPVVNFQIEESYSGVFGTCGSGDTAFDILEEATITSKQTTFFDRDGNRTRITAHFTYSGTFTNARTGESFRDGPDPQLYVLDFGDLTRTIHGLMFSVNVPGEGVVLLDAGTIVTDARTAEILFQSGPHHLAVNGFEADMDTICAALA